MHSPWYSYSGAPKLVCFQLFRNSDIHFTSEEICNFPLVGFVAWAAKSIWREYNLQAFAARPTNWAESCPQRRDTASQTSLPTSQSQTPAQFECMASSLSFVHELCGMWNKSHLTPCHALLASKYSHKTSQWSESRSWARGRIICTDFVSVPVLDSKGTSCLAGLALILALHWCWALAICPGSEKAEVLVSASIQSWVIGFCSRRYRWYIHSNAMCQGRVSKHNRNIARDCRIGQHWRNHLNATAAKQH